jgi:hypothetical protein
MHIDEGSIQSRLVLRSSGHEANAPIRGVIVLRSFAVTQENQSSLDEIALRPLDFHPHFVKCRQESLDVPAKLKRHALVRTSPVVNDVRGPSGWATCDFHCG